MIGTIGTGGTKDTTTGGTKDTTTPSKDGTTGGTKPTDGVKPGTPTKGETAPSKSVFGDSKSAEMKTRVAQITAANTESGKTTRTGEINTAVNAKIGKSYQLPKGMGTGIKFGK
jgi:hypothetical protein